MVKKRHAVLILLLFTLIAGCSFMNTITFQGEGKYWEVEVLVHQRSGTQTEDVTVKYKGDSANVGEFEYMVTANRWGMGFTGAELNKDGLYQHVGRSHNQHATSEDEELIIEIKWNDKVEKIVLKSEG